MTDRSDILQVLSRYLSAVDLRDGGEASAMFAKGGIVEVFVRSDPVPRKVAELMEHELVAYIIDKMLPIHSRGEFCRHLTTNHIVAIDGMRASLEAQFIVVKATPDKSAGADLRSPGGPLGATEVKQSGVIRTELGKTDGVWRIVHHHVLNDLDWPEMPLS